MQRRRCTEVEIGITVSPPDSICTFICHRQDSFKLFRCWWKLHKIRKPIETGIYDAYIAKYIPGTLELVFQGILEDIDT